VRWYGVCEDIDEFKATEEALYMRSAGTLHIQNFKEQLRISRSGFISVVPRKVQRSALRN
jgi:hypothetical protein